MWVVYRDKEQILNVSKNFETIRDFFASIYEKKVLYLYQRNEAPSATFSSAHDEAAFSQDTLATPFQLIAHYLL